MIRHLLPAMMMISIAGLGAEARTIFVSNEKGNSISIVDGDTLELIKEVPVGQRPRGIVLGKEQQVSLYLRLRRRHHRGDGHRDLSRSSAPCRPAPIPNSW